MQPKLWQKITLICLLVSSILLAWTGCAGSPVKKTLDLEECLTDSKNGGLQCSGPDEKEGHFVKYQNADGYICRKVETDKAYWDACFLQKQPR